MYYGIMYCSISAWTVSEWFLKKHFPIWVAFYAASIHRIIVILHLFFLLTDSDTFWIFFSLPPSISLKFSGTGEMYALQSDANS